MEPAVTASNLSKRFGSFVAVDRISFSVARGEVLGFLGPNGAGKSTTIRMLCGLLRPTSGTATVLGHDAARHSMRLRSSIGYMSQQFSLYGDLTAEENVTLFAGLYGIANPRLRVRRDWALETAGLADRPHAVTRDLSRGHKQALALACALIHEPRLLFLDEPTAGVDPMARTRFWELVRSLASDGVSFLVSTHHMDEAERCDRLAMIYRGRIVALDTPRAVKEGAVQGRFLELWASPLPSALAVLERSGLCRDCSLYGNTIHAWVDSAADAAPVVTQILSEAGIRVDRISRLEPDLETAFIALIEQEDRKWRAEV